MQKSEGLPAPRRYFAILAVSTGTFVSVLDASMPSVALPSVARDLNIEASSAVLLVTVYQLVLVMTLLPFSALGDRIGLRRLYQYGQLTFATASLLFFFAKSLPFLLVVRGIQALGGAAVVSVASALVRSIYPLDRLGRGLALNTVMISSSAALAPTMGGLILSVADWQWIFVATAPLALLSLWVGHKSLPDTPPAPNDEPYDVFAAVLCALTFGLVISGLESLVHGDSPVVSVAIIVVGMIVGFVFVRRELTEKKPILPVDLLANRAISLSVLGGATAFVASMTMLLSMPFKLQEVYGFTPGEVGTVISPWPFGVMVMSPLAGVLSDRIPVGLLGGIGMSFATVALLLLAFLPADATHFDIAWRMALSGIGFGLYLAPNSRLIVGSAPRHRAASAGGMVSTLRMTGQTLGATLAATLLAMHLGSGRTPALVAAGLALIAGICSVARLNPSVRKPAADEEGPLGG